MRGQLWQKCKRRGCSTEPVCAACFQCARHCTCPTEAKEQAEQERGNRRQQLRQQRRTAIEYIKVHGEKCDDVQGNTVFDDRRHGVGYVARRNGNDIYLSDHTESKVSEWAVVHYRLKANWRIARDVVAALRSKTPVNVSRLK